MKEDNKRKPLKLVGVKNERPPLSLITEDDLKKKEETKPSESSGEDVSMGGGTENFVQRRSSENTNQPANSGISDNTSIQPETGQGQPKDGALNPYDEYNQERIQNAKEQSKPIEPKKEIGLGEEIYNSVSKGANRFNKMLFSAPEFLYDIAAYPQNKLAELTGQDWLKTSSEKVGETLGVENKPKEYYQEKINELAQKDRVYEGSVTELISKGEYKEAGRLLTNQVAESLPTSVGIMLTGGATSVPVMLGGTTIMLGSDKYEEVKDREDLSEEQKLASAIGSGLAEGMFETLGTGAFGRNAVEIITKEGVENGTKVLKSQFKDIYGELLKKYGVTAGVIGEGLEEASTQYTQNVIDKYTGVNPDAKPYDGVADAFLVGAASGGLFSSGIKALDAVTSEKVSKDYVNDIPTDNAKLKKVEDEITQQVKDGDISEVEAEQKIANLRGNASAAVKVPEQLPNESKAKAVELIKEKSSIEAQIEGKDPNLVVPQKERIKQIDEELVAISTAKETTETETKPDGVVETKEEVKPKVELPTTKENKLQVDKEKLNDKDVSDISRFIDIPQEMSIDDLDNIPRGETFQERLSPEYYEKLKQDIKENGIKEAMILKYFVKDNAIRLFEGHHRLKIAKELGIKNIPIQVNVVWNNSIKDGNEDIKDKPIVNPPTAINKDKYAKRFYSPSNINIEELGYKNKYISEAYHKAKADGSNPELVEAVEKLLAPVQKTEAFTENEQTEKVNEEVEAVSKSTGTKAKNIRDLYNINRDLFGLDRVKSLATAVTQDIMIGVMAKRAGITKGQMYDKFEFRKGEKAPKGSLKQDSPIWKSTAKEGLSKLPNNPMTPEAWVKQISEKGGKGTVQELEWIGLNDFLQEWKKENNTKSVPKEVVEQYINDNQIEIVEVTKSENKIAKINSSGWQEQNGTFTQGDYTIQKTPMGDRFELVFEDGSTFGTRIGTYDSLQEAKDAANTENLTLLGKTTGVKYSNYTLEGGENYREVLLTLPERRQNFTYKVEKTEGGWSVSNEVTGDWMFPVNLPTKEEAQKRADELNKQGKSRYDTKSNYKSSHWDEANILAHLRINERTLPNGERVLFIEEVQSDWAQEGKKKGFGTQQQADRIKEINKRLIDIDNDISYGKSKRGDVVLEQSELIKERDTLQKSARTPNMPYKKTDQWVGMAMRRVMQMASQEGFDRVAWVTGEQSAERYDLSKSVDDIRYIKNEDGSFQINAFQRGGNIFSKNNMNEQDISDTLGKEIAEKITNGVGEKIENETSISGEGLKVGGEGMKSFYNSILPKVAKKEAQRFDKKANVDVVDFKGEKTDGWEIESGTTWKVKDISIKEENNGDDFVVRKGSRVLKSFDNLERAKEYVEESFYDLFGEAEMSKGTASKQLSVQITPEMRMNLNSAIPLFQGEQGAMLAEDGRYIIYALTNPNVSTPMHELAHVYEHYLTDVERNAILKWAGHTEWTTETSEKFARGFERYLANGVAPNAMLQKIFDKFKQWLTDIYKGIEGSDIDIKLNSKMKDVYVKMLGGKDRAVSDAKNEIREEKPPTESAVTKTTKELYDFLDDLDKKLTKIGKENMSMGIPIVVFQGAVKSAKIAAKTTNEISKVIDAAIDYIRESDWYKDLTKREKLAAENSIKEMMSRPLEDVISEYESKIDLEQSTKSWIPRSVNKVLEDIRSKIQDRWYRLNKLQKLARNVGKKISDDIDVYTKKELQASRVKTRIDEFKQEILHSIGGLKKSLLDRMTDDGVDLDELGLYMYALHAKERNKSLKELAIEEGREDVENLSGMSDQQADEIIAEVEKKGLKDKFDKHANEVRDKIINPTLDLMFESGLITQEQYDKYTAEDSWENYVPLLVEEKAKERKVYPSSRFGLKGGDIFRARGSNFYNSEDRLNPIISAIVNMERTIRRSEENSTFNSLVGLAREINDSDVMEVYRPQYIEYKGKIIRNTDREKGKNIIEGKVDGKVTLIDVKDDKLFDALAGKSFNMGKAGEILTIFNNYLRGINTLWNPEFMVRNVIRDLQTATINISSEDADKMAANMLKNVPKAFKGVYDNHTGVSSEWSDLYEELKAEGGVVSWLEPLDIEVVEKEVRESVKDHKKNPTNKKSLIGLAKAGANSYMAMSEAAEMGTRLAAYKAALDVGYSKQKAASLAKNLTVNFEKKGSWGTIINTLYLFSNAGIQGTAVLFKAMTKKGVGGNRARKIAASVVVTSFINSMINGMSDDDEWEKIEDEEKARNMIWMLPNGNKVQIPLPYGYNILWTLGQSAADIATGRKTVGEGTISLFVAFENAFNPLSSNDLIQAATPTVLKPLVQLYTNKNYRGAPIYPDTPYNKGDRKSSKYFKSVRKPTKEFADWLNKFSGGTEVISGKFDISPEQIDHVIDFAGGGLGRVITNSFDIADKKISGEEIEMNSMPFARIFYRTPSEYRDLSIIYETLNIIQRKELTEKQKDKFMTSLKSAYKEGRITPEQLDDILDEYSDAEKLKSLSKQYPDIEKEILKEALK